MPLPADDSKVETAKELLAVLKGLFGEHPGCRPAHAKGILVQGSFVPTARAAELSRAPHFNRASTPVIARFSSGTGIPQIADGDANGNPKGFAIRFMLAEQPRRVHTDIVSQGFPYFPAGDGPSAAAFFGSVAKGTVASYIADHPVAKRFVEAPRPTPSSFGREHYFGLHAFEFINAAGQSQFIRYRITPVAGVDYLDDKEAQSKSANFLEEEIRERIKAGPVSFKINAQLAQRGDVTDDNTQHWPEDREIVELGTLTLTALVENDAARQKTIIFDPVPRVDGINPSADPLLDIRAALYLLSGRERRAA